MNLDLDRVRAWLASRAVSWRTERRFVYGLGFLAAVEFVASVLAAVGFAVVIETWTDLVGGTTFMDSLELVGMLVWELAGIVLAWELATSTYRYGLPASRADWVVLGIVTISYVLAVGLVGFAARTLFSEE